MVKRFLIGAAAIVVSSCAETPASLDHPTLRVPSGASFSYGDEGTYPELGDGSANTSVPATTSSVTTEVGTTEKLGTIPALLDGTMTTRGWFNSASFDATFTVKRLGSVVQTENFKDNGAPTWVSPFTVEFRREKQWPLNVPRCGTTADGSTTHKTWWHAITPLSVDWGEDTKNSVASTFTAPACPPPKARVSLNYGGTIGSALSITVPLGLTPSVLLDATSSVPGQDGGPAISSYSWTVGGSAAGSSGSFNRSFPSSAAVSLGVTDADGVTSNGSGSVDVSYIDPCDDPLTPGPDDCNENPPSGQMGLSGSSRDDGVWHNLPSGTFVCYVTDWYQWNGSGWTYTDSTIDYCDVE